MDYEISVEYTDQLLKATAFKSSLKQSLRCLVLIGFYSALAFILTGLFGSINGVSWHFILQTGLYFIFVITLIFGATYRRSLAEGRKLKKKLGEKPFLIRFSDEFVMINSELGNSELKWKAFERLWRFKDFWLLFNTSLTAFILPKKALSTELENFILENLKANHIKID
ncbi:YcxB family protein [Vampirovibrio sp.]|uniref:YcxB family protein n=1 Tax=Vampirovibrio sp. TaxID=2717857 RepID=UPI003593DF8A